MLASYACVQPKGDARDRRRSSTTSSSGAAASQPEPEVVLVVVGLDAPTIESYPKFIFPGSGLAIRRQQGGGMCSICLGEYAASEVLRRMPDCKHCFHASCVDEWLQMSATVPSESPVTTPLSELIPLAVHVRGENVGVWTIFFSIFCWLILMLGTACIYGGCAN